MKTESFTVYYMENGKKVPFDGKNTKKTKGSAYRYAKQIIFESMSDATWVVDDHTGKTVKTYSKPDILSPLETPGEGCPYGRAPRVVRH